MTSVMTASTSCGPRMSSGSPIPPSMSPDLCRQSMSTDLCRPLMSNRPPSTSLLQVTIFIWEIVDKGKGKILASFRCQEVKLTPFLSLKLYLMNHEKCIVLLKSVTCLDQSVFKIVSKISLNYLRIIIMWLFVSFQILKFYFISRF